MNDASLPPRLLLFDGVCAVCDATVQWVLDRDPTGRWAFAPLQGETAAAVRARHPEWPAQLDSLVVVLQEGGEERILFHTAAVLRVARDLGGPFGALAAAASWVPAILRDPFYRAFARVRYRVFGRIEACRLVPVEQAARFLA